MKRVLLNFATVLFLVPTLFGPASALAQQNCPTPGLNCIYEGTFNCNVRQYCNPCYDYGRLYLCNHVFLIFCTDGCCICT